MVDGRGRLHEVDQCPGKRVGLFAMREVTGTFEDFESAPRNGGVRRVRLLHRDDPVVVAPHDQRRYRRREVQLVGCAHTLARLVDDGAQGLQERSAASHHRRASRSSSRSRRGVRRAGARPAAVTRTTSCRPRVPTWCRTTAAHSRHPEAWQHAQQEIDVLPQAAARDEHEPLAPLGELVHELRSRFRRRGTDQPAWRGRDRARRADRGRCSQTHRGSSRHAASPTCRGRGDRAATTVKCSASAGATSRQVSELPAMPWMSTMTGPDPAVR